VRLHDLQKATTDKAPALVNKLFLALGRGDWAKASPLVEDPLDVFGRLVTREQLAKNDDASLQGVLERLEELPEGEVDAALLDELVGLAVGDDRVFFATTRVSGEPVSYGVVVADAGRAPLVRALFDPRAFKAWALAGEGDG
jgi:hypothetical protein